MAWSEWGPADGAPVLFSPGAATSSSLGFAAGALERLGARLIAVDRPGLGGSDPAPDRTLLDRRRMSARSPRRSRSSGRRSSGSRRARRSRSRAPRPAPSRRWRWSRGPTSWPGRRCAACSRRRSGSSWSSRRRIRPPPRRCSADDDAGDAHRDGPHGSPEVDRAVYLEPAFAAAFAAALDEGFVQGPDGFARDTLLAMQRWPFDPAEIRAPVHLWYGSLDAQPLPLAGPRRLARAPHPGRRAHGHRGRRRLDPVDARRRDPRRVARGAAPRRYLTVLPASRSTWPRPR